MPTDGKAHAIRLLTEKQAALNADGFDRLPQRSDFSPEEIVLIKAHLGPWPRALEAAALKPPRDDGFAERKLEKRIRAKRRKTAAKIRRQQERSSSVEGEKSS